MTLFLYLLIKGNVRKFTDFIKNSSSYVQSGYSELVSFPFPTWANTCAKTTVNTLKQRSKWGWCWILSLPVLLFYDMGKSHGLCHLRVSSKDSKLLILIKLSLIAWTFSSFMSKLIWYVHIWKLMTIISKNNSKPNEQHFQWNYFW